MILARASPSRYPPSASIASAHTGFEMTLIAARFLSMNCPVDRELAAHSVVTAATQMGKELPLLSPNAGIGGSRTDPVEPLKIRCTLDRERLGLNEFAIGIVDRRGPCSSMLRSPLRGARLFETNDQGRVHP